MGFLFPFLVSFLILERWKDTGTREQLGLNLPRFRGWVSCLRWILEGRAAAIRRAGWVWAGLVRTALCSWAGNSLWVCLLFCEMGGAAPPRGMSDFPPEGLIIDSAAVNWQWPGYWGERKAHNLLVCLGATQNMKLKEPSSRGLSILFLRRTKWRG